KISDVIKNSKEASLETTAKLIASQAEKKYTENQVLDNSSTIKCSDVVKINNTDYESCNITFDSKGNAKVTIVGKGKFEGMAVCNANKSSASISSDCSTAANYFSYEEVEGGISITGYNIKGGTDVVIPSQIDGKTVVAIGDDAFTPNGVIPAGTAYNNDYEISLLSYNSNNKYEIKQLISVEVEGLGITSVVIPDTITSIGINAFEHNELTQVVIPSSVTQIGMYAFYGNKLRNVELPNNILKIESGVFRNNELTSIILPESLTEICEYAFSGNKLTNVTIPSGVTSIGKNAFVSNPNIVIINNSSIGNTEDIWKKIAGLGAEIIINGNVISIKSN
ncbi:MAG: leucine-rich repeat domain-containing protein, partial [Tenericutes bacterium]|nr:leucine-rich repeat domain-containing protein [Mycoplasmatota bacterium]